MMKTTDDVNEEEATKKFGEEDLEDLYGEKITSEGFTVLRTGSKRED